MCRFEIVCDELNNKSLLITEANGKFTWLVILGASFSVLKLTVRSLNLMTVWRLVSIDYIKLSEILLFWKEVC